MKTPKRRFAIELEAGPSGTIPEVPGIVRLRRALKLLRRAFALTCLTIRELPDEPAAAPETATTKG